jgi:hypothetical protein
MAVLKKIKRAVRGDVKLTTLAREALRRSRASREQQKERASLDHIEPLALRQTFAREAKFFDWPIEPDDAEIAALEFGKEIQWTRDPVSNYVWPLEYHRDLKLIRTDGSDVRVLWELNRLGHFLTLARAYSLTNDERYTEELVRTKSLRAWPKLDLRDGSGIASD